MKRQLLCLLAVVCLSLFVVSCEQDNTPDAPDTLRPQITVVVSLNGLGDNGYNDLLISGVFAVTVRHNVDLSMYNPGELNLAKQYINQWVERTADRDSSLLILASDDYVGLIDSCFSSLTPRQRVLVIDAEDENWPNGVYGFKMQRYGCSYLSACIAQYENTEIWAATRGRRNLEDGISGFQDGMKAHSSRQCLLYYITGDDDEYTFNMQDSVYRKMKYQYGEKGDSASVCTIYPMLGNSVNGIIRFLNAQIVSTNILIGMDNDMGMRCNSIPFSVVNHLDRVTAGYITDWLEGREWKKKCSFGLASGMMEIMLSPNYYDNVLDSSESEMFDNTDAAETRSGAFWVSPGVTYAKKGTFGRLLELYKEEAIRKEEIYEKK